MANFFSAYSKFNKNSVIALLPFDHNFKIIVFQLYISTNAIIKNLTQIKLKPTKFSYIELNYLNFINYMESTAFLDIFIE